MKKILPVYRDQDRTYIADRCKPLTQAVGQKLIGLHALARAGYPGTALNGDVLPGLLSVGYWDAPANQTWGLETHCNEGIELTFMETGKLIFQVDKKYTLKPGTMTITRPWQPHSLGDPHITPGRLHWIILDVGVRKPHQNWCWPEWFVLAPADLKKLTTLLRQNETPVWSAGRQIGDCFKKIAAVITNPEGLPCQSRLTILINELFLSLYENLKKRRVKLEPELITSHRTVELFLERLTGDEQSLCAEWTVETMADHCHLGVTHFTHLCKTITNMTPMRYLNHQRIEASVAMLQHEPELSITEIAFRCGFNSSQYFATVFKQFQGYSPKSYKRFLRIL
jgi:AraC family L-rhamnose operon regulatory protein RhaS